MAKKTSRKKPAPKKAARKPARTILNPWDAQVRILLDCLTLGQLQGLAVASTSLLSAKADQELANALTKADYIGIRQVIARLWDLNGKVAHAGAGGVETMSILDEVEDGPSLFVGWNQVRDGIYCALCAFKKESTPDAIRYFAIQSIGACYLYAWQRAINKAGNVVDIDYQIESQSHECRQVIDFQIWCINETMSGATITRKQIEQSWT